MDQMTRKLILMMHKALNSRDDLRGAYGKFPDFFRMGTFIDSTHMKYSPPAVMHLLYRPNNF